MSGGASARQCDKGCNPHHEEGQAYTNTAVTLGERWNQQPTISTFCRRQESAVVTEFCNLVIVNKSMLSYKRKYRFWDSLSPKSDLKKSIYIITLCGPKADRKPTSPIGLKFTKNLYLRAGLLWTQKKLFWEIFKTTPPHPHLPPQPPDKNTKFAHVFAPFWGIYFKLWVRGKNQEKEMHFLHILWNIDSRVEARQRWWRGICLYPYFLRTPLLHWFPPVLDKNAV